MRSMLLATLAACALMAAAAPAFAAGGCGPGGHRGPYGGCRANWGPPPPGFVIGTYYPGRGYWDGRAYWRNRYRWHGGWRYR